MSQNGHGLANRLLRLSLMATERVIGTIGLNAVLRHADLERFVLNLPLADYDPGMTLHDYARLNQTVDEFFGRASANILAQIGEAMFEQLVRDEWLSQHFAPPLNEIMSPSQPTARPLHKFAELTRQLNPASRVDLSEQFDRYVWTMHACPVCAGRTSATPVCHVFVGLLRGATQLAGYLPRVEETHCAAMGAPACRFELAKIARPVLVTSPTPNLLGAPPATPSFVVYG